jgi:hypothetical protein
MKQKRSAAVLLILGLALALAIALLYCGFKRISSREHQTALDDFDNIKVKQEKVDLSHRYLVAIDYALEKLGLTYWASCGTMLGLHRHGGFIKWDYDIDIQMESDDFLKNIDKINEIMRPIGYQLIQTKTPKAGVFGRVVKAGDDFKAPHLDVFTLEKRTGRPRGSVADHPDLMCTHIDAAIVGTPQLRRFGDIKIYAMEKGDEACASMYGENWRKQIVKRFGQKKGRELKNKEMAPPALPSPGFMNSEASVLQDHYKKMLSR